MKSGNYDELMDKFYAGTATDDEIHWLVSQGLISQQDHLYAEALKAERDLKTDWDFEDFINKMPAAKVIPMPQNRPWIKRIIVAAAMVAAIITAYIFWTPQQQSKEIAKLPGIQKPDDTANESIVVTVPIGNEIKRPGTVAAKEKKEFIPSRSSALKIREKKPAGEKIKPDKKVEEKADMVDFQVTVNGKTITNEDEAIAITRESLAIVSLNLIRINELNPLNRIKSSYSN